MSKININALLQTDLSKYLENLGLLEDLQNGKILCEMCKEKLTIDQIGAIFYLDHVPKFTCRKLMCYQEIPQENK